MGSLELSPFHKVQDGLHAAGEPFVLMIEKLAVHVHMKARYVDNLELIPIIGIFHDVAGQESKAHAALHHIKDEVRIAHFKKRLDFKLLGGQELVQGASVVVLFSVRKKGWLISSSRATSFR